MEIYAYGNIEALQGVLHALVMIFGAADFADAVRVMLIIGFLVAACAAVFQMTHRGWAWLITVIVLYSLFFVPTMTIAIIDRLALKPPVIVNNVPWAAGAVFGIKSQLGHTLTNLFETALQTIPDPQYALPAELSFQRHGVMFGSRLIRDARGAVIDNPQLRADAINFIRNCVIPETRGGGLIDPTDFSRTTDLWALMSNVNPVLMTTYTPPGGTERVQSCTQTYSDISARLPAAMGDTLRKYAGWLMPGVAVAVAEPLIAAAMPAAFVKANLAAASASASELLLQNAMINHVIETGQVIGLSTSDPAALMMSSARAQATAQMNATYAQQAALADQALPITRNVVEAFLLGVFPIICLLSFALEGRTLKMLWVGYLFALVWVELWPIIYAILNYVGTIYAAADLAAAAYTPTSTGLSLDTAAMVYSASLRPASVVGSMITYVPMLAAALLWGFGRVTGAIPSMRELFSPGASAFSEAARGNASQGQMQMDRRMLTPTYETPHAERFRSDADGTGFTVLPNGNVVVDVPQNSVPLTARAELSRAVGLMREARQHEAVASQEAVAAETMRSSGFAEVVMKSRSRGSSQEVGGGVDRSIAREDRQAIDQIQRVADDWQEKFGLNDRVATQAAIDAALGLSLKVGAAAKLNSHTAAAFAREYDTVQSAASQEQISSIQSLQERLGANQQYRDSLLSTRQDRDDVSASFEQANRHAASHRAHLDKARSLSEQATESMSQAISAGVSFEKDPAFTAVLMQLRAQSRDHSANPVQQQIHMQQLLAQYLLSKSEMRMPERFLSGDATPTNPAAEYNERAAQVQDATGTAFDDAARRVGPLNTGQVSEPTWSGQTRQDIDEFKAGMPGRVSELQGKLQDRRGNVERELDLDENGMTRRSMTGRVAQSAAEQVGIPKTVISGAVDMLTGAKNATAPRRSNAEGKEEGKQ